MSSMKLVDVKQTTRFGLEYFVVLINGTEHASYWSKQHADTHAIRLLNKLSSK
jgi:hypothetical protein